MSTSTTTTTAAPAVNPEGTAEADKVPHRWRNLTILSGVSLVDNTEAGLINNVFPSIAAVMGLTTSHLGTISAVSKLIAVPAGPFWVWLATKLGRRTTLALTAFLSGALGIATGFAENFVQLLILTALMAGAAIGSSPISMAVISDSFPSKMRPRAMGFYFASLQALGIMITPAIALFLGISDGWRIAMWTLGGLCLVVGVLILLFFRDPGIGAAERQLADLSREEREKNKVTWRAVMRLFRIPTYAVMMISRLLSGHLLILIFGVQFLVTERGLDNAFAVIIAMPYFAGYLVSTLAIGFVLPALDRVMGDRGRVLVLQAAQVLFAIAAFFATQLVYSQPTTYSLLWLLMGLCVGLNPPVNRPMVSNVVVPELRGQAFAIWLTVFETIAWALFALLAGAFAATIGLQAVFFYVFVVLMLANALLMTILYWTYPRDSAKVQATLEARRLEALS